MKPIDLIAAAAQAHTWWPDADIRPSGQGLEILTAGGEHVGHINGADGAVHTLPDRAPPVPVRDLASDEVHRPLQIENGRVTGIG